MALATVALWILIWRIERGTLWAALVLAICSVGSVILGLVAAATLRANDPLGWLGLALFVVPTWLALRAVPACRRLRQFGRRPNAPLSQRPWISQLPRDAR